MLYQDLLASWWVAVAPIALLTFYFVTQSFYTLSLLIDCYVYSRPVNRVDMRELLILKVLPGHGFHLCRT